MASHSQLSVTENYTSLLETRIEGRMQDQARMFDPATSSPTNLINNAIRWSSASNKWQKWNGTTWLDLTSTFAISISGNSATATKLATARNIGGVSFDGTANIDLPGVNTAGNQNTTGNAATVTNGVYTVGNQSISGVKTFNDNIGVGATPSNWGGGYGPVVEFKSGAAIVNNQINDAHFTVNCIYNGSGWIYKNSNTATRYEQFNGGHYWLTAPAGTAGNAISFTQAMTLDANGNLGIGTSSPNARVTIAYPAGSFGTSSKYLNFYYAGNEVFNTYMDGGWVTHFSTPTVTGQATGIAFDTSNIERLRINSAGKLILSAANQGIQFADGTTQTTAAVSGVYLPTLSSSTGNFTVSNDFAFYYTKVGQMATVHGRFQIVKQTASAAGGQITISLPFAKFNDNVFPQGVATSDANTGVSGTPSYFGTPLLVNLSHSGSTNTPSIRVQVSWAEGYQGSVEFIYVSFAYVTA